MRHFFKISQTFQQVTPESAEHGDYSDQGYEMKERDDYTISDIISLIKDQGNEEAEVWDGKMRIYGWTSTICYRKGIEEQKCAHITGSKRNIDRLAKILKLKGA